MGKHASNDDRKKLIDAVFSQKMSLDLAAKTHGFKYKTASKIINIFRKQDRIDKITKLGRKKKFGSDIQKKIEEFFAAKSDATLKQCKNHLELVLGEPAPCLSTINRFLTSSKFSLKVLSIVPEQRNTEGTKELRKRYATRYSTLEVNELTNFIYIDEFGCNLHLRRNRGRSLIGTAATIATNGSRGNNLSVCAAINASGPILFNAKYNAFNNEHFINFIKELNKKLDPSKQNILVMDNVSFHKTSEVRDSIIACGLKLLYLPPYSPMLNPIEECFSKVKNIIKQQHSRTNRGLMEAVEFAFNSVTSEDCSGWIRHSKKFFPQCINKQDINTEPEDPRFSDDEDEDMMEWDSEDELIQDSNF